MKRRRAQADTEPPPDPATIYEGCTTQWERWEAMDRYTKALGAWARDNPEREAIKHDLWSAAEMPGPLPEGWI